MAHATSMHAHSPASYSISLVIHAAIVAAILLSARALHDASKKNSAQVFELVAGEGNNYMAREAPAAGSPEEIAFHAPPDAPRPVVAEPEPTPLTPVQETPVTTPPPDAIVTPSPIKPKPKPKPAKPAETKTTQPKKTLTWAEFQKQHGKKNEKMPSSQITTKSKQTATGKPIVAPTIGKGLAGGVDGGTGSAPGAGGKALTAGERSMMDGYFANLAQLIKNAQEKPEGLSSSLSVRIEFQVAANGSIGAVKIVRSSGNRAFDDSVLKAIRSIRKDDIGPRPDGRSGPHTADFYMREED